MALPLNVEAQPRRHPGRRAGPHATQWRACRAGCRRMGAPARWQMPAPRLALAYRGGAPGAPVPRPGRCRQLVRGPEHCHHGGYRARRGTATSPTEGLGDAHCRAAPMLPARWRCSSWPAPSPKGWWCWRMWTMSPLTACCVRHPRPVPAAALFGPTPASVECRVEPVRALLRRCRA